MSISCIWSSNSSMDLAIRSCLNSQTLFLLLLLLVLASSSSYINNIDNLSGYRLKIVDACFECCRDYLTLTSLSLLPIHKSGIGTDGGRNL